MVKLHRPAAVITVAGLALVLSAGGAYAYWTVSGAGQSTATVATVKPLVITPLDIKGMVLGKAVPLTGEVSNPNDFDASLLRTLLTIKPTVDPAHSKCLLTNFEIVAPTTEATSIRANGTVTFGKGTITLRDDGTDQKACQGATLTLEYLLK